MWRYVEIRPGSLSIAYIFLYINNFPYRNKPIKTQKQMNNFMSMFKNIYISIPINSHTDTVVVVWTGVL